MLTLEEIQKKLSDRNISEVARRIGVTRVYLSSISKGERPQVSYGMVKKISDYLEGNG